MPIYVIHTPEGKTIKVHAPDGTTQEQAIQFAMGNVSPAEAPSYGERAGLALKGGLNVIAGGAQRLVGDVSQEFTQGVLDPIARVGRTLTGGPEGAYSAMYAPPVESEGATALSQAGTQQVRQGLGQSKASEEGLGYLESLPIKAIGSVPTTAAALGAGMINPTLGIGVAGLSQTAATYGTEREQGTNIEDAFTKALTMGAVEGITEKMPIDTLLTVMKGPLRTKILKRMAAEGIQESSVQAVEEAYDAGILDKKVNFWEALGRVADAGLVGGVAASPVSAYASIREGGDVPAPKAKTLPKSAPKAQPTPVTTPPDATAPVASTPVGTRIESFSTNKKAKNQLTGPMAGRIAAMEGLKPMPNKPGYFIVPDDKVDDVRSILDPNAPIETPSERLEAKLKAREETRQQATVEEIVPTEESVEAPDEYLPSPGEEVIQQKMEAVKTGQRLTEAKKAKQAARAKAQAEKEQFEEDARLAQQDTPLATEPIDFQHRIAPTIKNPPLAKAVAAEAEKVLSKFAVKLDYQVFDDFNDSRQIPTGVKEEASRQGLEDPPAFRIGNKIYINSNKIRSAKDVVREVLHEADHIAEELYHGDGLAAIHQEIVNSKRSDVQRMIATSKSANPRTPQGIKEIGGEVLATLAQKNPGHYLVRKAVHQIKTWINKKLGGKYALFNKLSDNDIIVKFILPARKYLETGTKNNKFEGVSTDELKTKLSAALVESRANPKDKRFQNNLAEIESELEARDGRVRENALQFSHRQSNKELYKVRAQIESELKDPHLTESQITELDKHLAEIDREIHDNNVQHMKTMVKSKKKLTDYKPDFQHNLTDYKQMDNDRLKRVYLDLLKRGVDRVNEPDYNDIVDETIKVGQELYGRGIDTTRLPKFPDVDDLGEVLPPDTTLAEADAERFAMDIKEAKETPKEESVPKVDDSDLSWKALDYEGLVRSERDILRQYRETNPEETELRREMLQDLSEIRQELESRKTKDRIDYREQKTGTNDESIDENKPHDDRDFGPDRDDGMRQPPDNVDFQHNLENYAEENPSVWMKPYDWVLDNVRSASDFLKKGEGRVQELGKAIKDLVIHAQTNRGMIQRHMTPMTDKVEASKNRQQIVNEFGEWVKATNAGETFDVDSADPITQQLIEATRKALDAIGAKMTNLGMTSTDPKTKKKVPFKMREDFVPAILLPKYRTILTNRGKYRTEFNEIAQQMIDSEFEYKGEKITSVEEARDFVNKVFNEGNFESGFFGDMGMSKELPFPSEFYDHSLDAVRKYMDRAAERLAQVEAFTTKDAGGKTVDLFDETLSQIDREAGHKDPMYGYVASLKQLVYNDRFEQGDAKRVMQILNTAATGLQLAGPKSVGINAIGGLTNIVAFSDMKSAMNAFRDLANKDMVAAAEEIANRLGITSDDALKLLSDNEAMGISKYAGLNKASRFVSDATTHLMGLKRLGPLKNISFNSSENKVRITSLLSAKHQLDSWKEAYLDNPLSVRSKVFEKYCRDEGINLEKMMKEDGWDSIDSSPESARFYQTFVNRLQGSYRLDQVPRWLDTWYGRFLFKYNKYGFQVGRMIDKQIVEYIRNPDTRQEGVENMMKYMALYSSMGILTAQIIKNIFGDDKLPSAEEFKKVFDDKSKEKNFGEWLYLLKNVMNSMHVLGAMGPISIAKQRYDQYEQFGDNPLSMPGLAIVDNMSKFIGKWLWSGWQGDPKELGKDAAKFLSSNISLVNQASQALGTSTDKVPRLRAGRTLNKTRQAIQRYIDATGTIDRKVNPRSLLPQILTGEGLKNKVLNDKVNAALMINDPEAAKAAFKQVMDRIKSKGGTEDEKDSLNNAISSSVLARRPFAVYGKPGGQVATQMFKDWAETHLPPEEYAEMEALDDMYMRAAYQAGLISKKHIREVTGRKALKKYERSQRPMRGK